MSFKLKAKVDKAKLKQIVDRYKKLLRKNIFTVIQRDAIPHLITLIMSGFDGLGDRMELLPEDPTNPSNWRQEFLAQLEQDLSETFRIEGDRVVFGLGNKDALGYTASEVQSSGDNTPLHWLVFYIEGLAGEFAFIPPEVYVALRGKPSKDSGGKFGSGFMINKDDFFKEGWNTVADWSSLRHPFSSFSPLDIFTEALREFSLRPFLRKAFEAASEGRKL